MEGAGGEETWRGASVGGQAWGPATAFPCPHRAHCPPAAGRRRHPARCLRRTGLAAERCHRVSAPAVTAPPALGTQEGWPGAPADLTAPRQREGSGRAGPQREGAQLGEQGRAVPGGKGGAAWSAAGAPGPGPEPFARTLQDQRPRHPGEVLFHLLTMTCSFSAAHVTNEPEPLSPNSPRLPAAGWVLDT